MRQFLRTLIAVAVITGLVIAATRWPRINDVETGRTPEYPQLVERTYPASEAVVGRAAKDAVAALDGWTFVGAGAGRGGTAVQAVATRPSFLKTEMTITIKREGAKTAVRVRARSQFGPWDFGQGARHIQAFLAELDGKVAGAPAKGR